MKLSLILSLGAVLFLTSCDGTDHAGNGGNTGQRGGPNSATGRPTGGGAPVETTTEETTKGVQGNEGAGNSAPASSAAGSTSHGVHQN